MSTLTEQMLELHPDDLVDLRRSGLSDVTISSMNCSSSEVDTIRLRTGVEQVTSGGYRIPYSGITDQTGEPYMRWRLRQPIDGMRYVAGVGDDPQLYVPPALTTLPSADLLVVTEGEKKAAKAVQEGIHCVGVQGVWSWCNPDGRAIEMVEGDRVTEDTAPLKALVDLASGYKYVLVLGDSDLIDNSPRQKIPSGEQRDRRFFAPLGNDGELRSASLKVKYRVGWASPGKENLPCRVIIADASSWHFGREKSSGIKGLPGYSTQLDGLFLGVVWSRIIFISAARRRRRGHHSVPEHAILLGPKIALQPVMVCSV